MDIYSGLAYGNMQSWIWWQGSELSGISNYSLMSGITCGKKYYVSKHFFRFIRPGAVRISCTSDDPEVFAVAFEHQSKETETIVIINSANASRSVILNGSDLPSSFNIYVTTGGGNNCSEAGTYSTGGTNRFDIPAMSVVTLQAGGNPL
jgi:O-glycosyl hydrolase